MQITACGNMETEKETENISISEMVDYEDYSGNWSIEGVTHDEIIANGGAEMTCTIRNGNVFSGSLYTQQAATDRFASVEGIIGVIENNELFFEFTDDGWGGTGTLHIQFANDRIVIDVSDYRMAEDNLSGYGVSGHYEMIRSGELETVLADKPSKKEEQKTQSSELTEEGKMLEKFYEQYYPGLSSEEIEAVVIERSDYYCSSGYYETVTDYWETVREVRDIGNMIEPLFFTDMKYYAEEDFENVPTDIIHLAKNEIYARHGYIFKDEDLNNYFMGCAWYKPLCSSEDFSAAVFNDFERYNLEVLAALEEERYSG